MNEFSDTSASSGSGRGAFPYATQSQEPEDVKLLGKGGRLARGTVGVMTFAPTLGFIGKLLSSATALGASVIAAGGFFAGLSEAQCTAWTPADTNKTCAGTQTGTIDIVSGGFIFDRTLTLSGNFSINNTGSGSTNHGLITGKVTAGNFSNQKSLTVTQAGTASDDFTISAAGRAVWLKASIATGGTANPVVNLTLIKGIQSRENVGAYIEGSRGHVNATFRNVSGNTGGIHARHKDNTAGHNMTITATRSVTTATGKGVYARKDTNGNLTLSLASVTGGSSGTSGLSRGVDIQHRGGTGSATVTVTGTITARDYGIFGNLSSNGNHYIKTAAITSSGDGVNIKAPRQLKFTSTGNIVADDAGFYLRRGYGSVTGALELTFSNITAGAQGIYIYMGGSTSSPITITSNGSVTSTDSGNSGIHLLTRGTGGVTLNIKGDVQGGGRRTATEIGYAIHANAGTSSAAGATAEVTINVTSGTVRGSSNAGAILNGSGNSRITFSGSNATLSGDVKLGLGRDSLVISGATVTAGSELDGGQEAANSNIVDTLTFRNGAKTTGTFLTLDPAKINNWERINLSGSTSWRIVGTKTLTADNVSVSGTVSLSEAAAGSRSPDDRLTISGNFIGGGTIVLDVNLATGSADTVTVTGNVTGVTTISVNDLTPSNATTFTSSDITVVTVQGTTASSAFTSSTIIKPGKGFKLEYRQATKTFVLKGASLRCTESEGTAGEFTCSGAVNAPEVLQTTGTTNLVATLNSASTTVASSLSGYVFTLRGQNGVTFTQQTGGGTLAATGSATGILDASTTGNGNIAVTLVGAASLAGSGTAVKVSSTGTGTITVSTNNVTANHSQAMAVKIAAAGTNVLLDAKGTISGGIEVKNTHTTGTATVSASAAVSKNSGTAIYAYGKGNLVEVKTSSTVTGSATGADGVGGIKVVNKSSGAGAVSISAAGTVTASGGIGIHAENDGTGNITITAAAVTAANHTPIGVVNRNSGDITLNISGVVTGRNSTTAGEGIKVVDSGSGDIEINTVSVTGGQHGILVEKNNSGSVEITISGAVTGRGGGINDYGIGVQTSSFNIDTEINLSNHKVVGGYGVSVSSYASGDITISSSGEIEGKRGGIYIYSGDAVDIDIDVHTVTASAAKGIDIQSFAAATGSITIASGGKIEAESFGIAFYNYGSGAITLDASGTISGDKNVGVWIDHNDDGAINLTTTAVTGGKEGIKIDKEGGGNVTLTSTGLIKSKSSSGYNAVEANVSGDGNISLTVSALESHKSGIFAKNVGSGTVTIVSKGNITASGTGTKDAGIYAYTNASGGNVSITVESAASVNGKFGIYTESKSSGNIEITTSNAITGTGDDGISAKLTSGTLTINVSGNVTGSSNKTAIDAQTSASGNSLITIHSGTITAAGATGKAITNGAGSSTIVIHSSASVTADIALGAGLDKLTFSGGSNFDNSITIDGGEDTGTDTANDELHINSISSLLDVSKITNWEVISLGSGTNARFDGTVTLSVEELKLLSGATLSMKDQTPGDTLTVSGKLTGGGTIEIDVNLSTGAKDSVVVQGNITGTSKIKVNNTTSPSATTIQTTIHVLTYTGTSSASAFSLDGALRARGYTFSLEHDSTNKRYTISGTRANLLCVEDTNTSGTFACAGTINAPEAMVTTGTTNVITTLANNATVNVSSFVALYMAGANGITFTQAANGGSINASGAATGAVRAKTTGNGNIQITLTGTATLVGSGNVVFAESTGTGNITITTQKVTATNDSADGIKALGKGAFTISANDDVRGGIHVRTGVAGGAIKVDTSGSVVGNSTTTYTGAIYVQRFGGSSGTGAITINTHSAVSGRKNGIRIQDTSSGSSVTGDFAITTSGTVTATDAAGISVRKYSNGNGSANVGLTINTSGAVTGGDDGIEVEMYSAGNVSITTNGAVTGTRQDGIFVLAYGENVTLNLSGTISGKLRGVFVRRWNSGSVGAIQFTSSGSITSEDNEGVNINGSGARSTVTATLAAVTGGSTGIAVKDATAVTLTANGAVTGTRGDGIFVRGKGATVNVKALSTVSGREIGITIENEGSGAGTLLLDASGAVTATNKQGIHVLNKRTGATTVTAAAVTASTVGIFAKSEGTGTSPVLIDANGAVRATSGTGIDAYGKGNSVTISTSSTVTGSGSRTTAGSVGGIKAVNKSSGAGLLSISAGGKVTSSGGFGIFAENTGSGNTRITAGIIEAHGTGVRVVKNNTGNVILNITGAISSSSNSNGVGISVSDTGSGNITVTTNAVTGDVDGINISKTNTGAVSVTVSGDITGGDSEDGDAGIAIDTDEGVTNVTVTLSDNDVTAGTYGVYILHDGDGSVELTSTGSISATADEDTSGSSAGVFIKNYGTTADISVNDVEGAYFYGVFLKHYGSSTATITVSSGGEVKGYETGVRVKAIGDGDVTIKSSGHIEGEADDGLLVYHSGEANLSVTVSTVTGYGDGVDIKKYGTGNVTVSATGKILSTEDSEEDGLSIRKNGSGNVSITTLDVEGEVDGIYARNIGTGTLMISANGDVVGNSTLSTDAGISARTRSDGGNASITVGASGTVSGAFGIWADTATTGNITITTSGTVTGTNEDGIRAKLTTGTIQINVSSNVTGASSKTAIKTLTDSGGNSIITINSGTIAASGGNAITNDSGASSVTIHSAASVTANISLGAGVDVLTFSGGSTFNRSITIDGGEESGTDTSTDVLNINSISALLDSTKFTNWEVISFGTGTVGRFDGTVTLATDELKVLTGAILSLKDDAPGDTLTIGGDFVGGGTIQIDVNLSTGAKDSIVVQGDISGVTKIVVNDRTPSNATGRQETIQLISYTGTSTSNTFSLEGTLVSQGYSYSIEFDSSGKKFNLAGTRTNLLCVEDTNTAGSFACAGTINISESMVKTGTTNIVATLANNATVSVSAFVALYMLGANGITFTQAANGGTINGTGNASGAIKAKTTGNGNIQMTLTGTATLAGQGNVVAAESTGTGNITLTTQKVTATSNSGRAIRVDGKNQITVNTNDAISGGVEIHSNAVAGPITVNASSTISSNNNDAIYVKRSGNSQATGNININTSAAITGNRHGIFVYDEANRASGTISINATGAITATTDSGVRVEVTGYDGTKVATSITTSGAVQAKKSAIFAELKSRGNITISAHGTLTSTDENGIYAITSGRDISITTSAAVSGGYDGIVASLLDHNYARAHSVTTTAAITGAGRFGLYLRGGRAARSRASVTATVGAVSGKNHAVYLKSVGSATLSASGAISSTENDGINVDGSGSTVTVTASSTVSGGGSGIRLHNGSSGAGTLLLNVSGAVTGTKNDGIHAVNKRSGATTITAASTVTGSTSGITARGEGTGSSPVSVEVTGAVVASNGTAIDAYGKGDSVTVTTSTTVTGKGSTTVTGSVGGIKAVNKSSGAGTVSVTAGGKVTTTGGTGIHAENEGTGGLTITVGEIETHGAGIVATNSNSGTLTLNISGEIKQNESQGVTNHTGDGIKATNNGADDLVVNTMSVTGSEDGIDLNKTAGGSITLTISGDIKANGDSNDQAGIAAINDSEGEDITLNLSNHAITGGYHGLYVYNEGEGNITVTATGTIIGSGKHGVYVNQEGGAVNLSLHTVSGKEYGLQLKHYGDSTATITLSTGGRAVGGETGVFLYGQGGGDISLVASGTIRGSNSDGLYVYQSGDASVTITVASVSGKSDGIDIRKYGAGNATLTATGTVESARGSEQDGLEALSSGAGNISITVASVTGYADGIDVRNYEGGTIDLNVNGAVVGNGTGASHTGIYAYADEDAGNITISLGSSGSVSGRFGISASSESSGNITINTSGAVTGTAETGIEAEVQDGEISITVSGNVTGSSSKVAIDTKSGSSGTTTIVINSGIIAASGGTSIQNNGGASDITVNSGATINQKISLGGGVDKLTFVGKAPATTLEIDGGEDSGTDTSVDVLTFSGFSSTVSATQLKNWETIAVVAGTTISFTGSQSLSVGKLTLSGGVVSLSDDNVGDSLSISGDIDTSGSLGIDVNLSSGTADTFTVTGNLTGTHKLIVKDVTPANQTTRVTRVKVVSVGGTTSSPSLTLQNRFKSGGFAYSLEYNATEKAFFLLGERSTLNCIESTTNPGNYTCRGNFSLSENILGEGSGDIVAVLDASAVVNVGAAVAMSLEGAGSITFTQAAGGGWINATGDATGVIHAKTSGSGSINISLTGTANLIASGTAILVDSTGTGTITVSTNHVTANNSDATAINLMGSGDSITLNTRSGVSGGKAGIIVKNVNSTGTVTISASTDVVSSRGTAIYAYGKGASVTISTGGQASGNAMGIKAVNKSTGAGSLTITAGNSVTGSSNTGIYATNSGEGGLAITAGVVTGGKAGIDARNYASGNLTINVTGAVNVPDSAGDDGINAYNKGAGDVTVSTVAVAGDASGVDIRNYGGGSITASFGGTIVATGTSAGDAGIVLINDAQGSDVTATITSAGTIRGQHGIRAVHSSSGAFLVNASGTITGSSEDGINVTGSTTGSITLNVAEVAGAKRAIVLTNTGTGSVSVTATGTVKTNATVTAFGALSVVNSGSTTLTLSAVQATETAVYVNSTGVGSSTITLNGAVTTSGDGAIHGVYTKAGTRAGDTSITVPTGGGVTGKSTAIKAVSSGSGSVTIVTSGNLAATHVGVHTTVAERGNISLNINNDVTVTDSASVGIETSTRSGTTTIVIGGGTIGGATSIKNNNGASTVTVNKGVELSGNIELGGGVDKLTFNESFDSTIIIDGGQDSGINRSKDVIAIESGKASIDLSKLRNWEIIQVGSAGTIAFEGNVTLAIEQVMLAGTLSLKNEEATDVFTLSGDLVQRDTENVGDLEVDVNFATGATDTISVSGDVTGRHNVTLVDVTPSNEIERFLTRITVVTVSGSSSESSFALTGTRFASGGYLYKLNYDSQARAYYLTGERGTLKCESSTPGVFACAGTLVFPENIRTIGDTAVSATLAAGSTVNVTAAVGIQMTSQNSISFTQASSGQALNASGNATGVVQASNTGRGDVSIVLTGTATLDGAGTAVAARSTGTGNVSVTTAGVVANHGSATAIRASGLGAQVSVNAGAVSAGRNGIIVTNRSNGGTSTVVTTGAVTSSGTGIYAFSLSGNVNVNAVGVAGGTSAVVAKNDGGSGNVSVTTTGVVTGSAGAIQVYNYGIGSLNVLASNQVTGRASDGITVIAGANTTSVSVSAASSTGQRNAIRVENEGTATANVTVSGNTVGNRGSAIHIESDGSGDINIIASSQVTGGPQGTGIETRTNGGETKITLNAGALVSGASGFAIRNDEGDSEISIRAGATVSGRVELGGGVDRLTFADATFGTSILNGGSDTGADVSVDVLTINGGSFVLSEDNFVNWESIVFGSQTNISVNGVSAITTGTLTVQGTLSMQDEVTNDTLTIDGNLIGGGTIKIDTDFFTGSTDSLTVSGNVTGRTTIEVNDISPSSGGQDQEAINIVTVTGASTTVSFSLADGGFTGGAYQYELEFLPATRQYVLSKKQSVGSVMLVAAPIALIDGFAKLPSLHERRSIDSTQSNWSRVIGNTNSYGKAPAGQAEYESQTTGLQAGFDFAKQTTPTGTWVYGFTAQFNSLNTDIKVASTEGELMADGYGVGATATWVGLNGGYLDIQAQYNQMTIDFNVASDTSFIEGQDATAMAISMELGKSHTIGENLTLLTNGQISWGLADIGDVKSTSGQPIVFGDDANITARFGMRLEYNEEPYKLHLLTNLYYDSLETWEATFANATYRDSKDPVSLELGLGGSMKLSPNSNLFMQGGFRKTTDDDFEQRDSAHFTTGVRWSW